MVALWAGEETIPGDPVFPIALDVGTVDIMTQEGFGPSPEESQAIIDEAERQRAIIAAAEAEMKRRQGTSRNGSRPRKRPKKNIMT